MKRGRRGFQCRGPPPALRMSSGGPPGPPRRPGPGLPWVQTPEGGRGGRPSIPSGFFLQYGAGGGGAETGSVTTSSESSHPLPRLSPSHTQASSPLATHHLIFLGLFLSRPFFYTHLAHLGGGVGVEGGLERCTGDIVRQGLVGPSPPQPHPTPQCCVSRTLRPIEPDPRSPRRLRPTSRWRCGTSRGGWWTAPRPRPEAPLPEEREGFSLWRPRRLFKKRSAEREEMGGSRGRGKGSWAEPPSPFPGRGG